jgi:hypothetical protein
MSDPNDASSWTLRCLVAVITTRETATPFELLYHLFHHRLLNVPQAHLPLSDESQTEGRPLTICSVTLTDEESFERQYKTVIQRLCSRFLQQLVQRDNSTVGVALTLLAQILTQSLGSMSDKTALDVVHEMMSDASAPSTTISVRDHRFAYLPLPRDDVSIRLLILLPSQSDSHQISCELAYHSLLDGTSYEALSYVWGDPNDTVNILVDSQPFHVTRNLFEALKVLRQPSEPRVLWADAICIDQGNLAERSSQVAIMGEIYRQATAAIAWLGPEPEEQKILFETLNSERKMSQESESALFKFTQNAYFQRAWIVQEIALSQRVIFQYGTSSCPLERLEHTLSNDQVMTHPLPEGERTLGGDEDVPVKQELANSSTRELVELPDPRLSWSHPKMQAILILMMRKRTLFLRESLLRKNQPRTISQQILGELLLITRNAACADPKDKVFSMLEIYRICTGQRQLLIEPDYRQSAERIMIDAAQSIIFRTQNLSVLAFSAQRDAKSTSLLPSWVLDWRYGLSFEQLIHQAAAFMHSDSLDVSFESEGRILHVGGFEIDKIHNPVEIDFSSKPAFIENILACIKISSSATNQTTYGTAAMWLAILYIVNPEKFFTYETSRSTADETSPTGPLNPANFPPQTLEAVIHLAETYWASLFLEYVPPTPRMGRFDMRKNVRSERLFATEKGSFVAAPATAERGDVIVAFPGTIHLFVLRKVGDYHFLVGVV